MKRLLLFIAKPILSVLILFLIQHSFLLGQCENNLLTNGGFENGNTSSWTDTGSPNVYNTCYNVEGDYYLWFTGAGGLLWQDVTAIPGQIYDLDYWDGAHTINGQSVNLVFLDADLNEISNTDNPTTFDVDGSNCLLEANSISATAPATAAFVRVEIFVASSGIKVDGFCLDTELGSISGSVSEDLTNNGDGDVGLSDIEIKLLDVDGNYITSEFTDVNGDYEFIDIAAGDYILMEVQPVGYDNVDDGDDSDDGDADDGVFDSDDMISVTITSGENDSDNNFVEAQFGTISGYLSKNQTMINDDGDVITISLPSEGVEVTLFDSNGNILSTETTTANGYYEFLGIAAGDYVVSVPDAPAGCNDLSDQDESTGPNDLDGGADPVDNEIPVTVVAGEDDEDNNFVDQVDLATISGNVTADTNNDNVGEAPIEGVEIKLLTADGIGAIDAAGFPIENVFTDENGDYQFTDLATGGYLVMEIQPDDYVSVLDGDESDDGDGSDGLFDNDDMISVFVGPSEDDADNNFIEELLGTISGDVTEDTNNDDVGEAPIEGVEIKLLDAEENQAVDGFGNPVPNVFTDANGAYEFVDLAAGNYLVMEVQPADYVNVQDGDESDDGDVTDGTFDTDDMIVVALTAGEDDENNDFIEELLGTISGDVTEDTNNDDEGDAPISGVEIKLLNSAGNPAVDGFGNPVANEFTDASGAYEFVDLSAGDYTVMEVQPADYSNVQDGDESDDGDVTDGTFDTDDMIVVALTAGEDDADNNFIEELVSGAISGTVTEDTNNDDEGDAPIEGVEIKLLDSAGNQATDLAGNLVANVFTDVDGYYEFTGLEAGVYNVMEIQPVDYIDVFDEDTSNDDAVDLIDSNFSDNMIPVDLAVGEVDADNDFVEEQLGTISGDVTEDTNNDDVGDAPIEGVEIKLLDNTMNPAVDGFGNPVANVLTDANGAYEFVNLGAANYIVMEVQPDGYADVQDGDESDDGDFLDLIYDTDNLIAVSLTVGEDDENNDFIEEQIGDISGHVFKMSTLLNDDGDIISVDQPVAGVTITLLNAAGNVVTIAMTDASGYYEFLNQTAGNYTVSSPAAPEGCIDVSDEDTSIDVNDPDGGNDPVDNEIPVVLDPSEEDADNDFVDQATGSISGSVTEDTNDDDVGDVPMLGVVITLCDANGNPVIDAIGNTVAPVATDASGYYEFTDLLPGIYSVKEEQPIGFDDVIEEDTSDDDTTDANDVNTNDNIIPVFLGSSEDDENNDFVEEMTPDDPCADWEQGEANAIISVGVVTNPGIIGSESDIVNITFVVVNTGTESLANVALTPEVIYFTGLPSGIVLSPSFAGDPNNNGLLDPNEIWFFSAVNSFEYSQGDSFIITGGATGNGECGEEIGGAADLLFTSGVNMDVNIEQDCVEPGETIDITLTTRLLIDEDAAKNPGITTIIVGGIPIEIQLPGTHWEARDLMISGTGLNGGLEFDPFNPPAGIELTNFCEQGGADAGRNNGNVLDECEPIETVRSPCIEMGDDDVLCEYPDWVFCYSIAIPEDYNEETFTVTATDDFSIWKAEESPAGSGTYGSFEDITANVEAGGEDSGTVLIKLPVLPVELVSFEATKQGRTSELTWETSSEINNSHFNVERKVEGGAYEVIGTVSGNGTTVEAKRYSFVDQKPGAGMNYYRLAQYDFDGAMERTEVKTVDFSYVAGSGQISVYPNPVVDYAVIESTSVLDAITVIVYSMDGKKVIETVTTSGEQIELSQVPAGQYTLKAYDSARYEIGTQQITVVK